MSKFKERVNQARQVKDAAAHQKKIDDQKIADKDEAREKTEVERIEVVKKSPEWQAMLELSQSPEFLEALELYWQKFSEKRGKTFEGSLEISKHPERKFRSNAFYEGFTHGEISIKFFLETGEQIDFFYSIYEVFYIRYNEKTKKITITNCKNEGDFDYGWIVFDDLDKFYDYMAEKIA